MFFKIAVLKTFAIFTGKHLWWSSLWPATFLKKKLQHRCFSVNIVEFLRTSLVTASNRRVLRTYMIVFFAENIQISIFGVKI